MRGLSPHARRTVLVVDSVAAAREGLGEMHADEIVLSRVPADLGDLACLPPGSRIELPWDPEAPLACRREGLEVRIRLSCSRFASVEEACRVLLRLSAERLPCAIDDLDLVVPADAARLVDLFLRDPGITAPVEPFATILVGMIRRVRLCLWDLLAPDASRRAVSCRGGVGATELAARLSQRAARPGSEALLDGLPSAHPECLESWCFRFCEAYALWAGSCEVWRTVLGRIASAARALSAGAAPGRPDPRQEPS